MPGSDTLGTVTVTAILPLPAGLAQRPEAVFVPVAGASPLLRVSHGLGPGAQLVVASSPSLAASVQDCIGDIAAAQQVSVRLVVAESPATRAQCVAAALGWIENDEPVLLLDIEWPIVVPVLVERVWDALQTGAPAAVPVLPVTDSVKAVDATGTVRATLDRAALRSVQYPRGYRVAALRAMLAADGSGSFDDAALASAVGLPVTLVDGDDEAMRVELPRDAEFLSAVLRSRADPAGR